MKIALHITQVTPLHIPSPTSDSNKLVAGYDPAPDLDLPGPRRSGSSGLNLRTLPGARLQPPQRAFISPHPPYYAVGTGSNVQEAVTVAEGGASWAL